MLQSAGAPGKDLLPPPRRIALLWFVSQVICAFLLRNADTYPILELQRGRTEVLNKGGTSTSGLQWNPEIPSNAIKNH